MKTVRKYLVVRANGEVRVVTGKSVRLRIDEVAFPLKIEIPDTWGQVQGEEGEITFRLPPVPKVAVTRAGKAVKAE